MLNKIMKIEEIKCARIQDEGENCRRCGSVIDNNESKCDSCNDDPRKDEWEY
tara:strand:- start:316 stop:471 length:156 start_codon:yes stop_codon:yes gene_type:complete